MKKNTGLTRLIKAATYSTQGFIACFKNEAAFRQELAATVILLPVAIYIFDDAIELSLLIGSLLIVLIVELLNSGIESVVDRIGTEHHELAGRAKDLGSAAVLLSLLNVVVTWSLLILEKYVF